MAAPTAPDVSLDDRRILTEATVNAADYLGLSNPELGKVIGVSASTISRMRHGTYFLDPNNKSWEAALLLVRLYRSLGSIVAGDPEVIRQWLTNPNTDLHGIPKELIKDLPGLVRVVDYLDAHRAVV